MSLEEKISQLIAAIDRLNTTINNFNKLSAPRTKEVYMEKLIPLARWNEAHDWPKVSAMRNIVYNKSYNGANSFVIKLGRRVYIDQQKFFDWAKGSPNFKFK